MTLDLSPLRPTIGVIMVADIAKQHAAIGPVHDDADTGIHALLIGAGMVMVDLHGVAIDYRRHQSFTG